MNFLCYIIARCTPFRFWWDWFPAIGNRAFRYYLTYPRNGERS